MNHPELFQQLLATLNTYAAYSGSRTTGTQRIALAKALEALYSSVEGQPSLSIQVDVNTSVIGSQKLRDDAMQAYSPKHKPDKPPIGFDSNHFIQDPALRMIAD
jgi:hypothetical protein